MKYTKCFLLPIILIMLNFESVAQVEAVASNTGFNIRTFDPYTGKNLIPTEYSPDIEGSPYLLSQFTPANIILLNGSTMKNMLLRFNQEKNEISFTDSLNNKFIFNKQVVRKVVFNTIFSNSGSFLVLKSGFPAIDKQDSNYLYEALAEGKIDLIKKNEKVIQTIKNELSGEVRKEFVEYNSYYIFSNKTIKLYRNDKSALLDMMTDKQREVDAYIASNKINFKKNADVVKLVSYYNSLF